MPAEGCVPAAGLATANLLVDASSSIGRFRIDLQVTAVQDVKGLAPKAVPPSRALDNSGVGLLIGGHEFLTYPLPGWEGYAPPFAMESAKLTLTLDGSAPVTLQTRVVPGNANFDQVAVAMPDVAGMGTLDVELTWADQCNRFEATASRRIEVVGTATTDGCEIDDEDAYWHQLTSLLDGSLRIAGTTARVESPYNEARFAPYVNPGIDAFIAYLFSPQTAAIVAVPGARIQIENGEANLRLHDDMDVIVWTRTSLATAVADYPPGDLTEVLHWLPGKQADGSFSFPAPKQPGRYVAAIDVTYESRCTTGTLWTQVNVDVVSPTS